MKTLITTALTLIFTINAFSQDGWDWGEDKVESAQKYQFVKVYMDAKKYQECRQPLNWLMIKTPNLNKNLYKRGSIIYKALEKTEKDPTQKKIYQDSTLYSYDQWLEKFGSEAETPNILDKKGLVYYKYFINRSDKDLQQLSSFYKKVIDVNGVKVNVKNIEYYMAINLERTRNGQIDNAKALEIYAYCLNKLDKIKTNTGSTEKLKAKADKSEVRINALVMQTVKLDCEQVIGFYKPQTDQTPQDLDLVNAARVMMEQSNCTATPYYASLLKIIVAQKPSASVYNYLAQVAYQDKKFIEAISYFNKSIELEADPKSRSKSLLTIAKILYKQGKKIESRQYANKVIATGYNQTNAHELIGDLYYNSSETCKSDNELVARSIYIAAYLEYEKAGATSKMSSAKAQFPSIQDMFGQSKKEGDIVNTGCWISKDVPLKKR